MNQEQQINSRALISKENIKTNKMLGSSSIMEPPTSTF